MPSCLLSLDLDKMNKLRIVIINGPNLNLLGKRQPAIYGTCSMEQVLIRMQKSHPDIFLEYYQSNHEGQLIDWIQQFAIVPYNDQLPTAIILNAGGYTHTSIALRDAVVCAQVPVVEVHVSNITEREPFRQISLLTDVCAHTILGQGVQGYDLALEWIIQHTEK